MKILPIIFFLTFFADNPNFTERKIEVIKFEQLEELINQEGEGIKIINFWATWCKPCIKELPLFEALEDEMDGVPVKVYLISMDFPEEADTKVKAFLERRNINSEVKLLDETDFNAFIDKVDSRWSGAIPATLIINDKTKTRTFLEKELHEGELEEQIKLLIE
ncbi:TlpA family protein disulfide reductase [Peijinzhouia sedimentorum]